MSPVAPESSYRPNSRLGKHKIFIGMAPGVGKTYKMLEEAQLLKQEGVDVVIGLLETHRRPETAEKAVGLEQIPRKAIVYGGVTLEEMDIEAILTRSPQLVLVDELAHANAFGSERQKRYEDVEIILKAGIDVYSTVNIQHLESLNDLVARITGIVVRERIPDRLLEQANQVVVVDITPETLEERLLDGKIYSSEQIQQSLSHFFQRRNLIALRELALREVADTVEEEANESVPNDPSYSIQERILVCVSTSPNAVKLIRRGARIAAYMNALLYVLFVDRPERFLTKDETLHLEVCEKLCQEFGGTFLHIRNLLDTAQAIAEVVEQEHITQIVIGESNKPYWKQLFRSSLTQRLIKLISQRHIDLHIIATQK